MVKPKVRYRKNEAKPDDLWLIASKLRGLGLLISRFDGETPVDREDFYGVGQIIIELAEQTETILAVLEEG